MMALAMNAPLGTELDRCTLDRARALEPVALRAFVARYERPVFALLSRMLGRGPHVEDLAQETFLRAFRALPAFRPDGTARASTWLLTIATRLASTRARRSGSPSPRRRPRTTSSTGRRRRPSARGASWGAGSRGRPRR